MLEKARPAGICGHPPAEGIFHMSLGFSSRIWLRE
jgi:hypothetical protein